MGCEIKAEETKRGPKQAGRFKDLPNQLPALMYAQDVYKQIQKQQIDASDVIDEGGIAMTAQALADDELALGKQLFEIAAACRNKKTRAGGSAATLCAERGRPAGAGGRGIQIKRTR